MEATERAAQLIADHGDEALLAAFAWHEGVSLSADLACVQAIIAQRPCAAMAIEQGGWHCGCTPLHKAAMVHWATADGAWAAVDPSVVQALLAANPAAAAVRGGCHNPLPLHDAIRTALVTGKTGTVTALLQANPEAVKIANDLDMLPLHIAAGSLDDRTDLATVEAVFGAHPGSEMAADNMKRVPLHYAAGISSTSAEEVVRFLLKSNPSSAAAVDKEGWLPLHCARDAKIVKALLEAHPAGAQAADSSGKLPLHVAAQPGPAGDQVVEMLLAAHPAGAQAADSSGKLPLHVAAQRGPAGDQVVKMLLAAHPAAACVTAACGRLPLHFALEAGDVCSVAEALSEGHPAAPAIVSAWEEIRRTDKKSLLRLNDGFDGLTRGQIRSALQPFGHIEHLHHVKMKSEQSLVLFASAEAAAAAYAAHNKAGADCFELAPGSPLHIALEGARGRTFQTSMGVMGKHKNIRKPGLCVTDYTYGTTAETGYFRYKDTGGGNVWALLQQAVRAMEKLFPCAAAGGAYTMEYFVAAGGSHTMAYYASEDCDGEETPRLVRDEMSRSIREAAELLLQLSRTITLRQDVEEDVRMWQHTVQMIVDKQLSYDDANGLIMELLSFCDQEMLGEVDYDPE